MPLLVEINKNLIKSNELSAELIKSLEGVAGINESTVDRFEVYINSTEVQRILNVSEPVVRRWVTDGLLTIRNARSALNNKYFLSEIEWLKKQHYRKLNAEEMRALVKRKNFEYKRI
ncbi:hypothetical protein L0657_06635 [Dyadobacter sp. CY345]|uniref:hypothetical protein n=1 Tax=Dyadobacter sp. CY345 TaxID=2909335 RepID=UPI001F2A17D8|nr:hypothetical protein [Dyadobacter sp. CY345]MCF2443626.1 hypothetical protein [Dyadobacter sp. CY345]